MTEETWEEVEALIAQAMVAPPTQVTYVRVGQLPVAACGRYDDGLNGDTVGLPVVAADVHGGTMSGCAMARMHCRDRHRSPGRVSDDELGNLSVEVAQAQQ